MKNFLLGLSIDVPSKPYIEFATNGLVEHDGRQTSGCGIAWYPGDQNASLSAKDPKSFADRGRPRVIEDKKTFNSTTFMMHLNGASWNPVLQDTEPYTKPMAKRDWIWMHQGTLDMQKLRKKNANISELFYEPVGNTDSELAFCIILNRAMRLRAKTLADIGWDRLHEWFKELNELGTANIFLSDGKNLVIYCGLDGENAVYKQRIKPPYESITLQSADAQFLLDFREEDNSLRTVYSFSTFPLTNEGWKQLKKGQMLVAKKGMLAWNSHSEARKHERDDNQQLVNNQTQSQGQNQGGLLPVFMTNFNVYVNPTTLANSRLMRVTHETTYSYTKPVEKSEHIFRLIPMINRLHQLQEYSLEMSVASNKIIYRDVFGNETLHAIIENPYSELKIKSMATIRIIKASADDFTHPLRRTTLPITWMPWQRQMMQAYILPQELPETQLRELSEYANSFVQRNDNNLFDTMMDINRTIYEDYKYTPGATTLATTAFEVYGERQGVCQDFANLFICLARLLGIPARYRMGYIYTGADYQNKIQSEATHAWAELYIPYVGWRGFDPTNGKLVDLDYIRVACGRNYLDATPTAGTLFKGGDEETLAVTVKTEILEG